MTRRYARTLLPDDEAVWIDPANGERHDVLIDAVFLDPGLVSVITDPHDETRRLVRLRDLHAPRR